MNPIRILALLFTLRLAAFAAGSVTHEEITIEAPFAMPAIKLPVFPKRDFPITDFGAAKGADCGEAIRKAIAACHEAGGGRVVVPAGDWKTGKIHFKSNVNLHLEKGAKLVFIGNPADYLPAVQSSWEGYECFNYSPLVYAFECENVALTGEGTLEADMSIWKTWFSRPPAHLEALKKLYTMTSTNVSVAQRQMAEGENHLRPQFIQFNRCKNVLLEGVSIRNSPFWTVHLLLSESVVVRGLNIYAHGHNNDGIDPENTRNLLVENCRFDQGDDAIAIKSGSNHDGWRLAVPTENVVIRNCTVVEGHQLVAIGSELSAGIRNVYVHDCRFDNPKYRLQNVLFIKTNIRRGGFVENIHMENIEAGEVLYSVLGIETDVMYQWKTLVPTYEERVTKISGIHLKNVKVAATGSEPFRILGDKRAPVRDVTLDHITIGKAASEKGRYENAENIRETNIQIGGAQAAAAPAKPAVRATVVLVGDSTIATKSGWGDSFGRLLAPDVRCENMGRGGRSSKSYRDEGHWQKALEAKPDWMLIQFGHNDQPGKGPALETDAKTTFRENLARYIAEAQAAGAKPVLVTSLTRRNFNSEGKINPQHLAPVTDTQGGSKPDFLNDYVEAGRIVAAEQRVPLLDLNARSIEQLNRLGPEAAVAFDAKTKDPAKPDKTHLSEKGAAETARLVADELRKVAPELAALLKP